MPYAQDYIGIYKIVNHISGGCYVGQSQRVKKRIHEHFRLLALNKHPNAHLQNSYNKYGASAFDWNIEVLCDETDDLDLIEEAFLSGEASFDEPITYNIASFAKAPMRGKKHTAETKAKIKAANDKRNFDYADPNWRAKLSAGQERRKFSDPQWVAKLKFVLDNTHMTYAERARQVGGQLSSIRKMYLKHQHLKGEI